MKKNFTIDYEVFEEISELNLDQQHVLLEARKAVSKSYSPYSNFKVGAAAQLSNSQIISAANQENASYPVTICAEHSLIATISSLFNNESIKIIAVSYSSPNHKSNQPISPCGKCRQVISEQENRFNKNITIILSGQEGKIYVFKSIKDLLPFSFSSSDF